MSLGVDVTHPGKLHTFVSVVILDYAKSIYPEILKPKLGCYYYGIFYSLR
jgi:hypothetical protein